MRLLTRSDFDGICCAVLLRELGVISRMVYAHPKDLQDGRIEVTGEDVLANVPYVEGCGMWFDHHASEEQRVKVVGFKGISEQAPSAARLIYNYYDGAEKLSKFNEMMKYVDKVDSADLTEDEINNPKGWVLLGFICDPRTGLGYHQGYKISNLQLMQDLVDYIRTKSIDEIMKLPDVKERVEIYFENDKKYREFVKAHSRSDGPVAILDTRGISDIPPGNRFVIYSLYPKSSVSVHSLDAKGGETVSITVGHNITNRTSKVDVGGLLLKYGGGGHRTVGTCQVNAKEADRIIGEIVGACKG